MEAHPTLQLPPSLLRKLAASGYVRVKDLHKYTCEQLLSNCKLTLSELRLLQEYMRQTGQEFKADEIHYPFINPLLVKDVCAAGVDLSQATISAVGLPSWAETPLKEAGIETLQTLACSSTFYIRTALGHGGRPQSILRQQIEDHLLRLLQAVQMDEEPAAATELRHLELSPRTLKALRRAGIFTVGQLQRLTDEDLSRVRGLGARSLAEIHSALPKFQPTPNLPDAAVQAEAVAIQPGIARRSIARLGLPEPMTKRLEAAGLTRIGDLLADGGVRLRSVPRIGKQSERTICESVERYMLSALEEVGSSEPETVAEVHAEAAATALDARIQNLIEHVGSARSISLLRWRFGLDGRIRTLQDAGQELGVSKERVRQLQDAAISRLKRLYPAEIESLCAPGYEALSAVGGVAPISYLMAQLPTIYVVERVHILGGMRFLFEVSSNFRLLPDRVAALRDAPIDALEVLDDAMVTYLRRRSRPAASTELLAAVTSTPAYKTVLTQYPGFSLTARARANPQTYVLPTGEVALAEWKRSRIDNIITVLREIGEPAHFRRIAESVAANNLDHAAPITPQATYNILLGEAAFVKLGRGVFGLAEWQQVEAELTAQIVAALQEADRPMHHGEIARALRAEEQVVERCLISCEDFVPTGRGYYKLAGRVYPRASIVRVSTAPRHIVHQTQESDERIWACIRISAATHSSGSIALNSALRRLFPREGYLTARLPRSSDPERTYRLHRGRSHLSGLGRLVHAQGLAPDDTLYIELRDGEYRLYTESQWQTPLQPAEGTLVAD